ncbi:hypothetical protein [Paraburkholderia bannensis]|uniref:hypothetical protein n=1 Tax=Paraburkholderia bannensis TaxID=765414 RepID=UPI002AB69FEE|nr:hypothetical protein [Paraburkholderia bannensis]
MDNHLSAVQRDAIMTVLQEALLILRDDRPLTPDDPALGKIRWVKKSPFSEFGNVYSFDNDSIPESEIKLRTIDDPFDLSSDRSNVPIVPSNFELYFYASVRGFTPSMLKEQLDLADYWIDGDGEKHDYNDMGPGIPPMTALRTYRYRANAKPDSKFPVDVELSFNDAPPGVPPGTQPSLWIVDIHRAYPYLTPETRKKKHLEAATRAQAGNGKSSGANQ